MKFKFFFVATATLAVAALSGCQAGKKGNVSLTNKNDSASYALGVLIGENNKEQMKSAPGVDQLNKDILIDAFAKALKGEEVAMKVEDANQFIQKFFTEIAAAEAEKNLKAGQEFLEANKSKAGVVTLPSGLQYEIITEGKGPKPTAEDQVKCHYTGTLIDGTEFDSSVKRGEPATFGVSNVIKGWSEALQLMPVGSKWKLYIPADLAYGERGAGGDIKPNSVLIFEVELLEIVKK